MVSGMVLTGPGPVRTAARVCGGGGRAARRSVEDVVFRELECLRWGGRRQLVVECSEKSIGRLRVAVVA